MAAPEKVTTIIEMLQINDHWRLSSGKTPSEIAQEFTPALVSLTQEERTELKEILVKLPIVSETRHAVEEIIGR